MYLPDKQVDSSDGGSIPCWMHVNVSDCAPDCGQLPPVPPVKEQDRYASLSLNLNVSHSMLVLLLNTR